MSANEPIENITKAFTIINTPFSKLYEVWEKMKKDKSPEELKSEEWKTMEKAYYAHLTWRFDYPRKTFGRQRNAYWMIMAIVFALVTAGVVFSYIQLSWSMKFGNLNDLKTELAATATSLSISSSVIGLFVLTASLAFFYLFLKHVFEIKHPSPPLVQMEKELLEKMKKSEEIMQKDKDTITIEEYNELKQNLNSLNYNLELMMRTNQWSSGSVYSPFASGLSGTSGYGTSGGWPTL
jgi:hypothetical protein